MACASGMSASLGSVTELRFVYVPGRWFTNYTGYKIWNRWQSDGLEGLWDRSRRPPTSPTRTPRFVEELIIDLRKKHRDWGPKKLTKVMSNRFPDLALPAQSTIAAILNREGLVEPRKPRRKRSHPGQPFIEVSAPNHLWTTDFKGHFRT